MRRLLCALIALFAAPVHGEDASRLVRDSDARTPQSERAAFHLPDGFEIQLFADDAQLGGKPINMAFDARGRLWVTCTREYPYAVKKEKWSADTTRAAGSHDTIRILEDRDGDGRADQVTIFADELNIPTGLQPYKNGCIAWSIPNILFLEDTRAAAQMDKLQNTNHKETPPPTKADKRTILFGPLGYERDTHGMISSMRLGLDGWIYATHGFSNISHFQVLPHNRKPNQEAKARNQETLDISSGSVFRFKPDGSAVELWTSGQVNPFGLCWDSWGNLYSADCHSSPIYQLIRGATYPQFGKPADALGFGPVMCDHAHGSTGIAGIVYIDGGVWGSEWDNHMFVGNPVTSKVNHDFITFTGSTPKANERPDFITCDDGWFRPVDLQLGPDGALYIADFYNKIIGHYEVPLDDQRRDRQSGRIWRVTHHVGKLKDFDLSKAGPERLVSELDANNLTRRYLATSAAVDQGSGIWPVVRTQLEDSNSASRVHALWVGYQLHALDLTLLEKVSHTPLPFHDEIMPEAWKSTHPPSVRKAWEQDQIRLEYAKSLQLRKQALEQQHLLRLLAADQGASGIPNPFTFFLHQIAPHPSGLVSSVLTFQKFTSSDRDPNYRRSKAEAFGQSREPGAVVPLYHLLESFNPADASGIHTARLALRNVLRDAGGFAQLPPRDLNIEGARRVAGIAVAVPSPEAAKWLLDLLKNADADSKDRDLPGFNPRHGPAVSIMEDHALLAQIFTHVARHLPAERQGELVNLVQKHFADDLDAQLELFAAVREGRPGVATTPRAWVARDGDVLFPWASALAARLAKALANPAQTEWQSLAYPGEPGADSKVKSTTKAKVNSESPWFRTMRKCADGKQRAFLDSHPPGGESLTGILRSKVFDLPPSFSFWLAGHRGHPKTPAHEKNVVRLVDAETGDEIAHAYPPRNDTAKKITWQTGRLATKRAFLELVDGDDGSAYAWLAAGGFEPPILGIPELGAPSQDRRIRSAAELATATRVTTRPGPGAGKHAGPAFPELVKFIYQLPDKESFSADTRAALAAASVWALWLWPREVMELARDPELAPAALSIVYSGPPEKSAELAAALKTLPSRAQIKLASALATSPETARALLNHAAPQIVADPLVAGKLKALGDPVISQRLGELLAKLPPRNDALNALIASRLKGYDPAKADAVRGEQVFSQICVVCHRIGIRGNLVGPQLDGIGARGAERLLEDILDPNRAVDPAFRLHLVKLKNGDLMTGLLRREQDDTLIFADAAAQEHAVKKSDIASDQTSEFSLMPAGMGEALTETQLHDLLKYLLNRKS